MVALSQMAPRAVVVTVSVLGVMACDSPKSAPPGTAGSSSATPAALSTSPDAASAARPAAPAMVDLLQATESDVAVSSNVDNPKDFPEHLVDGKPDTAWNGKTGDLKGWISFRVPDDAQVARILITAGFDKKNAQGDLFTMNHRIKKIRVTRSGEVVGEQALDIEKRTLQPMAIGKPGGTYKIEVVETEPGSKKEWKELCVSELRVLGTPGKIGLRATPRIPDVRVATLPAAHVEKQSKQAPNLASGFAKAEDFCKAFRTIYTPINAARTDYPGPVETTCAASDASSASIKSGVAIAPFVDALTYAAVNDQDSFSAVTFRTEKSWFFVGPHLADDGLGDPHCGGYGEYLGDAKATFSTSSKGPTALVTWHYGYENHGPRIDETTGALTGTFASSHVSFFAVPCVAAASGVVTCDKVQEVDSHSEDEPLSIARTWRSTKVVTVKPDGTLGF